MKIELNEMSIVCLALVVLVAIVVAERRAAPQMGSVKGTRSRSWLFPISLLVWLGLTAIYASSGLIQRDPRLMMTVMLPAFVGATTLASTSIGRRIAIAASWYAIVGFHAFRIVIEVAFHSLYLQGRLPIQVTYHGLNFDIFTGITAIALCLWALVSRPPKLVLFAWNSAGLVLVTTIGAVASLSMPTPVRQFTNEPSTILLSTFPYIWVPTFLAPVALAGHLVVYRKLMSECCSANREPPNENDRGNGGEPTCAEKAEPDTLLLTARI